MNNIQALGDKIRQRLHRILEIGLGARVTLIMLLTLMPLLMGLTWFEMRLYNQDMQKALLEKASAIATSGAHTLGYLWEQALAQNQLTRPEVFDTHYQPFAGSGEKRLTKYHTCYDAYTDEHWQALLDAYLTSEDIIYAVAVDRNGYVPTHNTRWSSGDGSAETDRAKRIFDDPVGLRAAQNKSEPLQQTYHRPDTGETLWDISAPIFVNNQHWGAFRVGLTMNAQQKRVQTALQQRLAAGLLVTALVSLSAWGIGYYLSRPISKLSQAVLTATAETERHDTRIEPVHIPQRGELTQLAHAFNLMAARTAESAQQLHTQQQTLEQQTQALAHSQQQNKKLTQHLTLATQIAELISHVLDPQDFLAQTTQTITDLGDHDAVSILLLDEQKERLIWQAGNTKEATSAPSLETIEVSPTTEALAGVVAHTGETRLVQKSNPDDLTFFDHTHLPQARSELVAPLIARDQVIGVLDIQNQAETQLDPQEKPFFSSLARHIGVALDNARLYRASQQALSQIQSLQQKSTRGDWEQYRTRQERDVYTWQAQRAPLPESEIDRALDQEHTTILPGEGKDQGALLITPIKSRDQIIGALGLQGSQSAQDGESWSQDEIRLVETIADQVAQALDAVRLLEETQKLAQREQLVTEITSKIRAAPDIDSILRIAVQETRRVLGVSHGLIRMGTQQEASDHNTELDSPGGSPGSSQTELGGEERTRV